MTKLISNMLSVFTLFLLSVPPIASRSNGKISINQSLTANINSSSWFSPNHDVAFGFHPYPNNENFFLLAIWYAKIPETIVWYPVDADADANNGNPISKISTVT